LIQEVCKKFANRVDLSRCFYDKDFQDRDGISVSGAYLYGYEGEREERNDRGFRVAAAFPAAPYPPGYVTYTMGYS
jgi:hypothetical protein